ncbi:hypothetical protein ABGB16_26945 [Micromonospora sp. B11E3]|uniref:hypothetical protein n=1 Tax=Micromonospora sp. B11E3 TaxID=3153562 RepID=UPI00325D6061
MDSASPRPYGRRFAAAAMVAGGVLYGVANAFYWLMFPDEVAETAGNVTVAGGNLGAWRVETVLFTLAHLLLLPAMAGLVVALGRSRPVVATIGGFLVVPALYLATVHLWHYNAFFGALAAAGVEPATARPVVDALDRDPFVITSFALWILGWLVGLLVLAFGAWRARLVPVWVPLALTAGQVLDLLSASVAPKLAVSVLMAAGLFGLSRAVSGRADARRTRADAATGPADRQPTGAAPPR